MSCAARWTSERQEAGQFALFPFAFLSELEVPQWTGSGASPRSPTFLFLALSYSLLVPLFFFFSCDISDVQGTPSQAERRSVDRTTGDGTGPQSVWGTGGDERRVHERMADATGAARQEYG